MVQKLILILLLLLPVPASAIRFAKTWDFSDASIPDGSYMGCRLDFIDVSVNSSNTDVVCKVLVGHTLEITLLAAGIKVATSIQTVSIAIFDGTSNVAASVIKFNETNTCGDGNLSGAFDTAGEYCAQIVSITLTEFTTWYVSMQRNDGTNDNLQDIQVWVEGTLTKN